MHRSDIETAGRNDMPEKIEVEVGPRRAATHEIVPDDIARTASMAKRFWRQSSAS
jgi:hypothetical protein